MVATATELKSAIDEFVRLLNEGIRVEAIILFGSYVNGKPHEWSDIDVAVISPDFEGQPLSERQSTISRLTYKGPNQVTPTGYPSSEYHNPGPHSFLREIIATGHVVYPEP